MNAGERKARYSEKPIRCAESGKKIYNKKKQALSAANIASIARNKPLDVYKCKFCGYWHMTSYVGGE